MLGDPNHVPNKADNDKSNIHEDPLNHINKLNRDIIYFNKLNAEIKYLIDNISDIALVTGNNSVLMEIYKTVDEFYKIK